MKKDLLIIFVIAVVLIFVISGTKIQSVEEYYLTHLDDIKEDSETVFLNIDCSAVLDNWDSLDPSLRHEKYVPSDGVILSVTEYVLRPGDTAFDILDRAAKHNKIPLVCVYSKLFSGVYVQGINHIFEFSCGPLSGWTYSINGVSREIANSGYKLKNGDVIEWIYSCDLGQFSSER